MARLTVIADDLTGALDTGVQFANRCVSVRVAAVNAAAVPEKIFHADVAVIDAEVRHKTSQQAYNICLGLVQQALRCGTDTVYIKTDSGLRGNIGAMFQAAPDAGGAAAAYALMSLFIITWVFDAGIIPQYIIYNQFGFVNNPWVMIVPGAINTQFLIITKTFLEGIPNELEEAAFVDGASDIKILTRVFLPLSPTVLATTGLFYAVSIWNQYLLPQIYLKDDAIKTIQQVLKSVVITDGGSGTTFKNVVLDGVTLNQQNLKAAAIFIAMLPIICVYPFVQKYFKKGILIGSVKG